MVEVTIKKARTYRAKSWWHQERDKRMLSMYESGKNVEDIADAVQLSVKYMGEILKLYRENELMRR